MTSVKMGKRLFAVCVVLLMISVVFSGCFGSKSKDNVIEPKKRFVDPFDMPNCVWKRELGNYQASELAGVTEQITMVPMAETKAPILAKRGLPLGGMGTGNFMYNLAGTFGPWEMKLGKPEHRFIQESAFHIYESSEKGKTVKTLATEDVPESWNKLNVGDGTYSALFPKGWVEYDGQKMGTSGKYSMEFFSPIIAQNYRETSYPVAVFRLRLENPTECDIETSVMFTFSNAPFTASFARAGFVNSVVEKDGITGIVMKATDPNNANEAKNSEWCIATKASEGQEITWVSSWSMDCASQIYGEFGDDGSLPNGEMDKTNNASAISVKITLKPGESVIVPFAISWDFPIYEFESGTQWFKRYTEYWGTGANNSFGIALDALENYEEWEQKIADWTDPIINNDNYPDWLKQCAFNELYFDIFGGIFWENGVINKERTVGNYPGQHLYFDLEMYSMANTLDVRHYCSRHLCVLWPEIERDILLGFADLTLNNTNYLGTSGQVPHDVGSPVAIPPTHSKGDPWFDYPMHAHSNELKWKDAQPRFILECYEYYWYTKDAGFLHYVWPACKAAYEFEKSTDLDGDKLPNQIGPDQTYDVWTMFGASSMIGTLWAASLAAMEKMAEIEEPALIDEIREWKDGAKTTIDQLLWIEFPASGGYYKKDTLSADNLAIMPDALNGIRHAQATQLEDILPAERLVEHVKTAFNNNVKPLTDYTGDGIGDVGAANGLMPLSLPNPTGAQESLEVWVGSTYFFTATMWHLAEKTGDGELKDMALKTAWGAYFQTWLNNETGYWFDTPEAWVYSDPTLVRAVQYPRARAIWELLLEIDDPYSED
jgi:non-lysosomal glucosylceramidase